MLPFALAGSNFLQSIEPRKGTPGQYLVLWQFASKACRVHSEPQLFLKDTRQTPK